MGEKIIKKADTCSVILYHITSEFRFFFFIFEVFQMKFHFQMFVIVYSKPHYMLILDHNCTDS